MAGDDLSSRRGPLDQLRLVEDEVAVGNEPPLMLLRPAEPTDLIDEDAFAHDEFLPYWAELWPAAGALVDALPADLAGLRVLELGCGLGLPSLVAARRGAEVLATDWAPDALELLALNASRNAIALGRARLDWSRPDLDLLAGGFDLVLGADLLYERRNVEPLVRLVTHLGVEVLLADPGRAPAEDFLAGLSAHFSRQSDGHVHRLVPLGTAPSRRV
ncbi:MAG: Methyltransferase type 12 [Acidimicrobiaceae bacterium]|nr:Methyltransferase type 12 [Acidimicrobiaceae bacterium]